jgi:hypothetical protein
LPRPEAATQTVSTTVQHDEYMPLNLLGAPLFDAFDDYFSPEAVARRESDAEREAERDREAMCALLRARGQDEAALIVAAARWSTDCVDNWNGGQYEAVLSVPPVLYDAAGKKPLIDHLGSAAEALIGTENFRGLRLALRRGDPTEGWDWIVAQDIIAKAAGKDQQELPRAIGASS